VKAGISVKDDKCPGTDEGKKDGGAEGGNESPENIRRFGKYCKQSSGFDSKKYIDGREKRRGPRKSKVIFERKLSPTFGSGKYGAKEGEGLKGEAPYRS